MSAPLEPGPATPAPTVSAHGIVKRFGAVVALAGVDFEVRSGEIHALLGENGAGKSTLMNILSGLLRPDEGEIRIGSERVVLRSPHTAVRRGIGMVHQHFMLVPTLTVAENMVLGERGGPLVGKGRLGRVGAKIRRLSDHYGLGIEPDALVWQLSVGEQQRVEILRALYHDARVLILDEPTATLTPQEADRLLPRLRSLADAGAGVVFITHHLDEVMAHTDRITVFRQGREVATLMPSETTTRELARMMVGRDVTLQSVLVDAGGRRLEGERPRLRGAGARSPVLRVEGLVARGDKGTIAVEGTTFAIAAGEVVAVAGVDGNGQAELEEALAGLREIVEGEIWLGDEELTRQPPPERLAAGMGLIPSDRYRRGLIRALSIADNLVYDRVARPPYGSLLALNRRALLARARKLMEQYSIQAASLRQQAGRLSGGNAQRVVLARTVDHGLRCLVAAQPTRGLDVGATEYVWEMLASCRAAEVAVLLISTDLDEVLALADRCYVMYRGRFATELSGDRLTRDAIGLAMGGVAGEPMPVGEAVG